MSVVYSLREVKDVDPVVVSSVRVQVISGMAVLASGIIFPPAIPFTGPIGSTLISEGICDIAIEVINSGKTTFDKKAYITGKVISYGISIATLGLSAITSSVSIMNKSIDACRKMAEWLRSCTYLRGAC